MHFRNERLANLFAPANDPQPQALAWLAEIGFADPASAWKRLRSLDGPLPSPPAVVECLHKLVLGLSDTPSPETALKNFERLLAQVPQPRPLLEYLAARPRAIEILLKLFVRSQYLTETLLRSPVLLDRLTQHRWLADLKSREEFLASALVAAGSSGDQAAALDGLRRFQQWEILRIGACDTFGLMDLRSATVQLSLLADSLVQAAMRLAEPEGDRRFPGFCVLALGKLGGEELNYSSDIDLIFLAEEQPERWIPLAQQLIRILQTATGEGFLYRVDMRLRPWGRSGALVSSRSSFVEYLRKHGELWEHQALLKARIIAGDVAVGQRALRDCESLIFGHPLEQARDSVRTAKRQIESSLAKKSTWGEVKSGAGSLRDIEFLAQFLQLVHGGKFPQIRSANTLDALVRLTDHGFLEANEYRDLTGGYHFLRTVEHALQLAHNAQTHQLPTETRELEYLAQRLDYPSGAVFVAQYERHTTAVRQIYDRYLGDAPETPNAPPSLTPVETPALTLPTFTPEVQALHRAWLARVTPAQPLAVRAERAEGDLWTVTVLGIDHPGDLSMICGLLFVYGFDILRGVVTTGRYPEVASQWLQNKPPAWIRKSTCRDFVNVFTVRPSFEAEAVVWRNYEDDLLELMLLSRSGSGDGEAQGRLAKRIASALEGSDLDQTPLKPVDVQLDNDSARQATLLQIRAEDTSGFLYELANALALSGIDIDAVEIRTDGERVFDTLWVRDAAQGGKVVDERRLRQLQAAVVLIKQFTHLLPRSSNPEAALLHFRGLLRELFEQPDWTDQLTSLERPEVLAALAKVLGVSDFLWDDFLRMQSSSLLPMLQDLTVLQSEKTADDLAEELAQLLKNSSPKARVQQLNDFKDREMFRVDMRHILGRIEAFGQFSRELTAIAETVVRGALELVTHELEAKHGVPHDRHGHRLPWAACVLGKCGGSELGFASDIEMLFLYAEEGETDGRQPLSHAAYFQRLVEKFTQSIRARREGIFHIDLRLRPYGQVGQLAVSLAAFEQYFAPNGPAWPYERQALVKLRAIAGDAAFGAQISTLRDQLLYTGRPFDTAAVHAMRERQVRQLVQAGTFHAKLSPGGLVDVEYLVQSLQITHGKSTPALRVPNTRAALAALAQSGIIAAEDFSRLDAAYMFLRRLIDGLRMVRGDARDLTVPQQNSEEFAFLARRLGFGSEACKKPGARASGWDDV